MPDDILLFAHIGDLHITDASQQNYADFRAIVTEIADELGDALDFVYLPGDNADNGLPAQYALVREELARLKVPVHVITGDHDMEPGSLENFYRGLAVPPLPRAVDAGGVRCLFLDICGPGKGGPDFRIGASQAEWLRDQLKAAEANGRRCAIFMHTYPEDLKGDGETGAVNAALMAREVLLVDMGHTHYNELANDGRTIFAATRSTGQIEEGPVGYTIASIDKRTVSWRFKALSEPMPLVIITAPADRRLATDADDPDHLPKDVCEVRVSVLGRHPVARCSFRIDDGPALPMQPIGDRRFAVRVALQGASRIVVEAEDAAGRVDRDTIETATREDLAAHRHANGSDKDAIGAWESRGIFGTQLGPNRNGRHW